MRSGDRPEQVCGSREDVQQMREAIDRLDAPKRTILMLRAFEELSYEEIAEYLAIPIGTVMSRLNRARAALMTEMKRDEDEAEETPVAFPFRKYRQA